MAQQILNRYQNILKNLSNEYKFIKTQYFNQQQLFEQIETLQQQIEQAYRQIQSDNKLLQRKRQIANTFSNSTNTLNSLQSYSDNFSTTYYLIQQKSSRQNNANLIDVLAENIFFNNRTIKENQQTEQNQSIKLYPNSQLKIKIELLELQPVLNCLLDEGKFTNTKSEVEHISLNKNVNNQHKDNNNRAQKHLDCQQNYTQANQIIPKHFTLHISHLNTHLKTKINYDQNYGLYQTGTVINGVNVFSSQLYSQYQKEDQIYQATKQSTLKLGYKFGIRPQNLSLYQQLFKNKECQNLIFSITASHDQGPIIAIAKLNFNQIAFQSNQQRMHHINNNRQSYGKLINDQRFTVVYFRKMISFSRICSLQQLPLFFKLRIKINVKQQITSPKIQDLEKLFYHQVAQNVKQKSAATIKNVAKQPKTNQSTKSPKKIVQHKRDNIKSNQKYQKSTQKYGKSNQKYNRQQSPSLPKSPHHKRAYVNRLIKQGQEQLSYRNTKKYIKFQTLNEMEIQLIPKQSSTQKRKYFDGQFYSRIQDQISSEDIIIQNCENISLKNCNLIPIFQYQRPNRSNNFRQNDQQDRIKHTQSSFKSFLAPQVSNFTIKIKLKICLKNKNHQGRMQIQLPFLQMLNKLSDNNSEAKYSPVQTFFQIIVKPNFLFSIQQFQALKEEQTQNRNTSKRQEINKQISKKSIQSKKMLQNQQNQKSQKFVSNEQNIIPSHYNKNKIIRIHYNIYLHSQDLLKVQLSKNHTFQKIYSQIIHSYYFKPKNQKLFIEYANFSVFPYGTVIKVTKNNGGGYMIYFKVNYDDYIYYSQRNEKIKKVLQLANQQNRKEQTMQEKRYSQNVNLKFQQSIFIQMAIGCKLTQRKKKNGNKINQIQYFDCQLFRSYFSQNYKQIPSRFIQIKQNQQFYYLKMATLITQNQVVNIQARKKQLINVVNGQRFKYVTSVNQNLIIQLLKDVQFNQFLQTQLLIDNWENGRTSVIKLRFTKNIIEENSQEQEQNSRMMNSNMQKSTERNKGKHNNMRYNGSNPNSMPSSGRKDNSQLDSNRKHKSKFDTFKNSKNQNSKHKYDGFNNNGTNQKYDSFNNKIDQNKEQKSIKKKEKKRITLNLGIDVLKQQEQR